MARLDGFIRQFNQQIDALRPEGYVLQGSVVKRYLQRRVKGASKTYGPYYLWTRKLNNKTVTHALTNDQADIIQKAIRTHRRLERRLAVLRTLSEQIILAITPCVSKRKRQHRPR
jgi:hypothetical protein